MWISIVLIVILVLGVATVLIYNALTRWKIGVGEAFAQLDVQLKRRYDLVPNLVETVKGYMKHERELLEKIAELRAKAMNTSDMKTRGTLEGEISEGIKKILLLVENYPDLKASENFMILQEELVSTENRIAYARQYYNDAVKNFNTLCQIFPVNLVAHIFWFKPAEFLEFAEERGAVSISF
ncbi:MAG TPA: LemA family protein [Candidatus Hydrothermia bacterium]|nr:LemA family protein [Candidatus Hydrothermae bacterium]HRD23078.1 LemA family protein [Candidatus Hydrothermia bacterium]